MANSSLSSDFKRCGKVTVKLDEHVYNDVRVPIMKYLCEDFIIGHDIMKDHSLIEIQCNGERPPSKSGP